MAAPDRRLTVRTRAAGGLRRNRPIRAGRQRLTPKTAPPPFSERPDRWTPPAASHWSTMITFLFFEEIRIIIIITIIKSQPATGSSGWVDRFVYFFFPQLFLSFFL